MKERILEFLKAENKTSAQLAEDIGVQPSGISHILSGRNNPSLDFILRMLEKYQFLSTDWLLFGKGSMYKEEGMQNLFRESIDFEQNQPDIASSDKETQSKKENLIMSDRFNTDGTSRLRKIVFFYENNSFIEYHPGES